ncbi:hypothetical protein BIW11_04730 [Tropilaelaps mercedesae]|uniref:Uncharacterized protein n=1 Tax=Tropilaelaps mercedesae TaxID=418985 RepID=A0A1V9X2J8_9ACAR|nr:hypothetical protein BIW11_04730 [Tropilaelaps mercedesae]
MGLSTSYRPLSAGKSGSSHRPAAHVVHQSQPAQSAKSRKRPDLIHYAGVHVTFIARIGNADHALNVPAHACG